MRRLLNKWRSQGLRSVAEAAIGRAFPRRAKAWPALRADLADRSGLEVGGPSGYFSAVGRIPVYTVARALDNCNFAGATVWEGTVHPGRTVQFAGRQRGRQFIAEATDLREMPDASYDFVISSNTLEHVANPIRALREWFRVVRPGGVLLLVLPHRDGTFDHRRPVTPLEHLVHDFEVDTPESDDTHVEEILRLHDLARDPEAGGRARFEARARDNLAKRTLHHHVFDTRSAAALVDHLGVEILAIEASRPYDILIAARKPTSAARADNSAVLRAWERSGSTSSPFSSDRR